MSPLKNLPTSELPRERLVRDGIDALSLQELLAILLGTGRQGQSVLGLSLELLQHFGGMDNLLNATIEEMMQIKGIGHAKAVLLKAAFGIALRVSKEKEIERQSIVSVEDVAQLAQREIGHLEKESLLVVLRDVKSRLIHYETISMGTRHEVLVHPGEVFRVAVRHGAYTVIVCHNHPSGDLTPSKADVRLTERLLLCGEVMGIRFVDHIIVSRKGHHSMITPKKNTP